MKSVAYEPGSELSGLIAERTTLAAEVERLTAELANRPPGYLAALDARDEVRLYLTRIMAGLGMVVNGTTYDEVVAQVKQLTAENATLRAQLDAATAWRPVTEPPTEYGQDCEIRVPATWWQSTSCPGAFAIKLTDRPNQVFILRADISLGWRPASPASE